VPTVSADDRRGAVNLDAIELRRVRLPLSSPFRTALGTETVREALLVRVETGTGEGWGECVAGADPFYSSEYVDAAWLTLKRYLAPRLLGEPDVSAAAIAPLLHDFKGHRMAKAALEMAVLDAELRAAGQSFSAFLGGVVDVVTPGVAVGIMSTIETLLDSITAYLDAGYRRVKLKIRPGWDLAPVEAVRERFGTDLMLQVDANAAYGRLDIDHLARLDQYALLLIEQPFDEEDLLGHAQLARHIGTPVCLDESILSARGALAAISLGACSIVNIKAGRVGGYLEARAIHDVCRAQGIPVWCGGMLETGLGRAANLALASLPGFTLPGDISATDRYFHDDITPPFHLDNGTIAVPTGPGLGVELLRPALDAFTTQSETLTSADR
jgi:O-succinylbenzoate synthase